MVMSAPTLRCLALCGAGATLKRRPSATRCSRGPISTAPTSKVSAGHRRGPSCGGLWECTRQKATKRTRGYLAEGPCSALQRCRAIPVFIPDVPLCAFVPLVLCCNGFSRGVPRGSKPVWSRPAVRSLARSGPQQRQPVTGEPGAGQSEGVLPLTQS